MDKKDIVVEYLHNLHHCTQAILLTYIDELQIPELELKKIAAAFGGGMGTMGGTCGALVGAGMVLGLKKSTGGRIHNEAVQLYRLFEEKSGATLCKDLKGVETKKMLCSCEECVQNAVEALESILNG